MARLPLSDPTVVLTCDKCGVSGPANEVFYLTRAGALTQSHCRKCEFERVKAHNERRPVYGPPVPKGHRLRMKPRRMYTTHVVVDGVEMKPCSKCKEVLPLDRFSPQKRMDGHRLMSQCKACRTMFEDGQYHAGRRVIPIEVARERARAWRAANPEKARMGVRRRRARIAASGGIVTNEEWAETIKAWRDRCAYCDVHAPGELTMDHVVPLSRGGQHIAENVVPACGKLHNNCNARKSARTGREFVGVA